MLKKKIYILLCLLIISQIAFSQIKDIGIVPFIKNYKASDYNAAEQNWAAVQDKRGIMYFANTDNSVLQFDGKTWNKIRVPEAVFSLEVDNKGTIFVGAKGDLGYLQANETSTLKFVSLKNKIPFAHHNFQNVWDIYITTDSTVCFQTEDQIFMYQKDTIEVIPVKEIFKDGLFLSSFYVQEKYFVDMKHKGLFTLEKGMLHFVEGSEVLKNQMIRGMLTVDDKILLVTWYDGIYEYDGKNFKKLETPIDQVISTNIYKAGNLREQYFAFSLNDGGMLITNTNFEVVQFIKSEHGLQNDQARNFFIDRQNNLWLCLANGISSINLFSPFTKFDTNYGFENESKTLTSKLYNNTLYVGTATGVYYKEWKKENKLSPEDEKFKTVYSKNGNAKTYHIDKVGNKLIGAGGIGIFEIIDNNALYILKNRGLRTFRQLERDTNVLIGGTRGLFLFRKSNAGNWDFQGNIKNFEEYSRYIEEDPKENFIWMSDAGKGVFKVYPKQNYEIAEKIIHYDTIDGLHGLPQLQGNYVFKLTNEIVFGTSNGIYKYNYKADKFEPYTKINSAIGENHQIMMIKEDSEGNIWIKQEIEENGEKRWELGVLKKTNDSLVFIKKPFLKYRNKIFSFDQIDQFTYIIGTANGFVHYDARIKNNYLDSFQAFIRNVKLTDNDSTLFGGAFLTDNGNIGNKQLEKQIYKIPFKNNNIKITYSAEFYEDMDELEFQYFLEGNDQAWSQWTKDNYKEYSNLGPGQYTFYVKARNIYGVESSTATYQFSIVPPWYRTSLAFTGYVLVFFLLIWTIVWLYTRRLRKQKEQLEHLVKIRTIEIEQQAEELKAQTEELKEKNEIIEKKNEDITSSIEYAERIQRAMLPVQENINKYLPENFILFKPRDIVSGDFYWFAHHNNKTIITAVDCTGHGVPGAFMSMIGAEILTTIVNKDITKAGEILEYQNKYIRSALKQDTSDNQDGMDMALCVIDKEAGILEFAGAKNPLIYIHEDEIHKVKGSRQSIGGHQIEKISKKLQRANKGKSENFKTNIIEIKSPMWFYIFSDGYQDQFGGPEKRKFMIKRMKQLIFDNHKKPMDEQKQILDREIEEWKNSEKYHHEQTDDILVIGFKL